MKKIYILFRLFLYSFFKVSGEKKAKFLKKHKVFKSMGENCFWQPIYIPSYPKNITIGNNVTVTANVKFFEHDEVHRIWNSDRNYKGKKVPYFSGNIEIGNNVCIGGNSIILSNVKIEDNVMIGAGSVVTKNIEKYSIVAGNPAKKIGDTRDLYNKRIGNCKESNK